MKNLIRQAEVSVRTSVLRVRTWFDPPISADARPLEIREAVIEQVEQRAEPAGGGRRVLPYNHVTVTVLAAEKDERLRLQATLAGLTDAVRLRLTEIRCQVPPGFAVEALFVKRPPAGWSPDRRLEVSFDARRTTEPPDADRNVVPQLTVTVIRGQASQPSYTSAETSVRIGRTPAPVDNSGRPRRNHIAFLEDGDEHSRTVGRAHASIRWDRERREYRLFDDGSHNGTRVTRNGATLDVLPRDPVGVALASGDEIELGTAVVGIEIAPQIPRPKD